MGIGVGIGLVAPFQGKAGFNPSSISGLLTWYKADAGLLDASNNPITSDGTAVKTWQDQSGNSNHLVQSTSTKQPLYKVSQQNGLPGILFDGTDDFFTTTSRLSTVRTVFVIHKWTATTGDFRPLIGDSIAFNFHGGAAGGALFYDGAGANTLETRFVYLGTKYVNGVETAHSSVVRYTTYKLVAVTTTANTNFDQISFDRTDAPRQFYGQMGEILAYDSALSATDRGKVETYLMSKWGLS
jgi:hypothetical protein